MPAVRFSVPSAMRAVGDADGVVGLDGHGRRGDGVGAAGDLQVVLTHDAVLRGGKGQGGVAVEHQVALGIDDAIGLVGAVEGPGDGQGAVAADGDKDLVRGLHIDGGGVLVGYCKAVQHQLDLVVLVRLHIHGHVRGGAGEHIDPGFGDADILPIGNRKGHGARQIGALLQIPPGEHIVIAENIGAGLGHGYARPHGQDHGDGERRRQPHTKPSVHTGYLPFLFVGLSIPPRPERNLKERKKVFQDNLNKTRKCFAADGGTVLTGSFIFDTI